MIVKVRLDEERTVFFSQSRTIQRFTFMGRVTARHSKVGLNTLIEKVAEVYMYILTKAKSKNREKNSAISSIKILWLSLNLPVNLACGFHSGSDS